MNEQPKRIQRKRTKGWRMPDGAVYVGRPTRWGNPFVIDAVIDWSGFISAYTLPELVEDAEAAVKFYRDWLDGKRVPRTGFGPTSRPDGLLLYHLGHLRGRDLACWCPLDQPCHADVLLELANDAPSPAVRDQEADHRG